MYQYEYSRLIRRFKEELEKPFVARSEEVLVLLLGLLTSEHVILIGEPGTAKSALARRAADLLKARFFKYLLTRYTEPDELLGPIDINALRQGKYTRITRNKLPEAEIVFLDEIFNASSAILNTLLTVLNERIIYDGYNEIVVPLWTMISASNTVPEDPEYQALYDRFLLRHFVKPISEDKWLELLDTAWRIEKEGYRASQPILSVEDLKTLNSYILNNIDLSRIKRSLVKLYAVLEDQGIHLTDRRKGKALKVIAAHALYNNRTFAFEEDLFVLKYIAPRDKEEEEKVYITLIEELQTHEKILDELREIMNNIREVKAFLLRTQEFDPRLLEYLRGFEKARDRIKRIIDSSVDEHVKKRAQDVLSELENLIDDIKKRLLL